MCRARPPKLSPPPSPATKESPRMRRGMPSYNVAVMEVLEKEIDTRMLGVEAASAARKIFRASLFRRDRNPRSRYSRFRSVKGQATAVKIGIECGSLTNMHMCIDALIQARQKRRIRCPLLAVIMSNHAVVSRNNNM